MREEREDGDTAVSSNDGDDDGGCLGEVGNGLGDEGGGADDVKSGYTEESTVMPDKIMTKGMDEKTDRLGSNTLCFLRTSAAMGTVELTGSLREA